MKPEPIRTWLVERAALGEAPPGAELTAEERRRVEALRAENDAALAEHPPARVAAEIQRRLARSDRGRRLGLAPRVVFVAGPALAVATLVVTVVREPSGPDAPSGPTPSTATPADPEAVRIKGAADLLAHRKTARGSAPLRSGDVVAPGDRVQLGVRLDAPAHVVVVSIDGRGVTTLHVPTDAAMPPPRFDAGATSLPFSYELDDAPRFERFFLVTAAGSFSTREVVTAAETLAAQPAAVAARAPLALPANLAQLDLRLRKDDL